jgi:hypothetical protein
MSRHFGKLAADRSRRSFLVALHLIQIRRKRNPRSDAAQLVGVNHGQLELSLAGQAVSQKVERCPALLLRCAAFAVGFRGAHLVALVMAIELATRAVRTVIRAASVFALWVIDFRL